MKLLTYFAYAVLALCGIGPFIPGFIDLFREWREEKRWAKKRREILNTAVIYDIPEHKDYRDRVARDDEEWAIVRKAIERAS